MIALVPSHPGKYVAEMGGTGAPQAWRQKNCFEFSCWNTAVTFLRDGGKFPWRPTPMDRVRGWFLSVHFTVALRLVLAQVWTGLFVWVR